MNDHTIVKANALVESTYRLSLCEQRVLLAIIQQLDSRPGAPLVSADTPFTLHARDFAEIYGVDESNAYGYLQDAADTLFQRVVIIDRPDPSTPKATRLRTRWIAGITYYPGEGSLVVKLASDILPFLTQLAREFTVYLLPSVAKMTSSHAVRLYELLVQWRGLGSRTVEVEWLRERFGLKGRYAGTTELRRNVIEPAVDQINAHSDLWVKWTQRKRGRTIASFTFIFGVKEHPKPKAPPNIQDRRGWIEKNARPGESWDEARDRLLREERLHVGK